MLLEGRNAIVYGGGGAIGGAVALAFAREGAHVFLAGRTQATLDAVADDIHGAGGAADTAVVDALDAEAVAAHADAVVEQAGSIDVTLNVISHGDVQGTPLVEMTAADVEQPVVNGLRTNFLTAQAAARHMIPQRSGVILAFGGYGDPMPGFNLGGLQVGFQAIDTLFRQFAAELGPHGVRVVTLQTAGVPESIPDQYADLRDTIAEDTERRTLLGRAATLADVGNAAVFAASDWARTMTATSLNITCGTEVS
jgi:3-oxoacyl-[acyl-carrier protein] reductase